MDPRNRYLELNGDPLRAGPIHAAFHSAALRVAVLTTIFHAACMGPDNRARDLAIGLGMVAVAYRSQRGRMEYERFTPVFGETYPLLCVDKAPKTAPLIQDYRDKARDLRNGYLLKAAGVPILAAGMETAAHFAAPAMQVPLLSAATTFTIGAVMGARQYHYVAAGRWTVTDAPEDDIVAEKSQAPQTAAP